jgi:hypothetical protein
VLPVVEETDFPSLTLHEALLNVDYNTLELPDDTDEVLA